MCSVASLPKLEVLVMAGCLSIDDTGLHYLEHGCPILKVLTNKCSMILFLHNMLHKLEKTSKMSELVLLLMGCRNLIFQDVMALVHMA